MCASFYRSACKSGKLLSDDIDSDESKLFKEVEILSSCIHT